MPLIRRVPIELSQLGLGIYTLQNTKTIAEYDKNLYLIQKHFMGD